MKDIRYLLSIKELLDSPTAEQLAKRAYEKLDGERKRKLEGIKAERSYAECLGAGLLLQLGVQEFNKGKNSVYIESFVDVKAEPMRCLTVSQALSLLGEPIEITYAYGAKGKPYFQDIPVFFNLSHSEDYVCCVFSGQEVGVDIQYRKSLTSDSLFFRGGRAKAVGELFLHGRRRKAFLPAMDKKGSLRKADGRGNCKGGFDGCFNGGQSLCALGGL